jgi:two-component system, OmpR family, alkaline phosphatase synthesis response regulator PhoP
MVSAESILIVDNDQAKWSVWSEALETQGYPVGHAENVEEAQSLFKHQDYGLALLNLKKNGGMSGIDFLDWIKEHQSNTDVIVVTTYAQLNSSLGALRKGAYDYLVTPVNIVEVISRVDRCMAERREVAERLEVIDQIELKLNQLKIQLLPKGNGSLANDHFFETQSIIVDRHKRLVVRDGEPIQLSPTEFDMLDFLASNGDRVVSASEIIRAVQGYDMDEADARPIVRVNIRRLRQKIEADTANPEHIITVRSRGYRFAG